MDPMDITSEKPSVHHREEEFDHDHFDAVIPRIGSSVSFYGCAVVRQFEMMVQTRPMTLAV